MTTALEFYHHGGGSIPAAPGFATGWRRSRWHCLGLGAFALGLALAAAARAHAADVLCGSGGDAAGWTLATGADFDGDGLADLAIGSPCARVGLLERAGRVVVRAGVSGKHLLTIKGTTADQRLGGAIAFVADLSGDGLADLIVGSQGWTVAPPGGTTKADAGKAEVYSRNGTVVVTVEGTYSSGRFGEAVAGLDDVDGDSVPDFAVGAGKDRLAPGDSRVGATYLVSGATGTVVDVSLGNLPGDIWGSLVDAAGDVNGDGVDDVLVASNVADFKKSPTVTEEDNGLVRILSGADFADVLFDVHGAARDKLGKAACMLGDLDGDGVPDLAVGSPGVTVNSTIGNAGRVSILSGRTGATIRSFVEPLPEVNAAFGSALANIGFVDGDSRPEFAASAAGAPVNGLANVGRVQLLPSKGGAAFWSASGSVPAARFGHSLAAVPDWNGDGRPDVAVSSPGDAFRGRRGAGSVDILSGVDGVRIARFGGRRGRETRLYVAGWNLGDVVELKALDRNGRRKEQQQPVFRGLRSGGLSVTVLDSALTSIKKMSVAVGSGHGATDPRVEIMPTGRRAGRLAGPTDTRTSFLAEFSSEYSGGVEVAAGELSNLATDAGDELAIAQADSASGQVEVSIYKRFGEDLFGRVAWARMANFPVFEETTRVLGFLVDANGTSVAVGKISAVSVLSSVVVAPIEGTPAVRVFDPAGVLMAEWLAYDPATNDGARVTTANLDNTGLAEIVTVPSFGPLRVRAFNGDGTPFLSPATALPLDFVVSQQLAGPAALSRLGVAVADVDLDGSGEILVLGGDAGSPSQVRAFEIDGTPVADWGPVLPFGPVETRSFALATTDTFIRHR